MVKVTRLCLDTSGWDLIPGSWDICPTQHVNGSPFCLRPSTRATIAVAIETKSSVLTIPFGDVGERSLSRHQDTFLMEPLEHLQWTVGQNHLLGADLPREAEVT